MPVEQSAQGPAEAAQPSEQSQNAEAVETTTQNDGQRSSTEALMDHLDIPEAVREQLRPKGEENAERPTPNAQSSRNGDGEEQGPAESSAEGEGEGEESEHEQEQEQDGEEGGELPKDVRKLQKRVARLTKKLRDRERALEQFETEREAALEQGAQQVRRAVTAGPRGQGVLGEATTEEDVDQLVQVARATRELVRKNPNGIQEGEGDTAKFYPPEDLQEWAARAQDVISEAESRRREIREFRAIRQNSDAEARKVLPEIFDRNSKEFQAGVRLVQQFPALRDHPNANEALAYLLRGIRAAGEDAAAAQTNGTKRTNGNGEKRAIDDRAFGPRVPIAPHTSGPSSRNGLGGPAGGGSSSKALKQATEGLLADADGSASSLAQVFAAMGKNGNKRDARAAVAA